MKYNQPTKVPDENTPQVKESSKQSGIINLMVVKKSIILILAFVVLFTGTLLMTVFSANVNANPHITRVCEDGSTASVQHPNYGWNPSVLLAGCPGGINWNELNSFTGSVDIQITCPARTTIYPRDSEGNNVLISCRTTSGEEVLPLSYLNPESGRTVTTPRPDGGDGGGGGGGGRPEVPEEDEEEDEDKPACEEVFDYPGAWLACLVIDLVDKFTTDAIEAVNSMLAVEPEEVNDDGLKQAWSYFRNIASLFLVLIGLAMIIGQAISKE